MYDAWKKKVMPDTTRIYYIDTWFLSQNLPYYQPETLTSFTYMPGQSRHVSSTTPWQSAPTPLRAAKNPEGEVTVQQFLCLAQWQYRKWVIHLVIVR